MHVNEDPQDQPEQPGIVSFAEADLGMPLLVVARNGGPYDEPSLMAGYRMGHLDAVLPSLRALPVAELHVWVPLALVPQLDLVAMRHGFAVTQVSEEDGGSDVTGATVLVCVAEPGRGCGDDPTEGSDDDPIPEATL